MSASPKGTIGDPGKNVKAKSGLNKSILDQGWFEFRRQLGYKLFWKGGELVEVDSRYTSQTVFRCLDWWYEENADVNAARNILTVGRTGLACVANCISGRQQEPAGNREGVLPRAS